MKGAQVNESGNPHIDNRMEIRLRRTVSIQSKRVKEQRWGSKQTARFSPYLCGQDTNHVLYVYGTGNHFACDCLVLPLLGSTALGRT